MITKHTLFIGLNDKDTKQQEIDTVSAYKLAIRLMNQFGYPAGTITEATGFYTHEDGTFTIEKSLKIEILFAEKDKTDALIKQAKISFNQESIALQTEQITSELV